MNATRAGRRKLYQHRQGECQQGKVDNQGYAGRNKNTPPGDPVPGSKNPQADHGSRQSDGQQEDTGQAQPRSPCRSRFVLHPPVQQQQAQGDADRQDREPENPEKQRFPGVSQMDPTMESTERVRESSAPAASRASRIAPVGTGGWAMLLIASWASSASTAWLPGVAPEAPPSSLPEPHASRSIASAAAAVLTWLPA